jgi:outer membrane protein OmpA-like peptidoglycan-associated protein
MTRSIIPALTLSCLIPLAERPARAEGVVAERFHPAATSGGYIVSERPETIGHLRLFGALSGSYARAPLIAVAGPFSTTLIEHAVAAEASFGLGLWRFTEVGLTLPVTLYQDGRAAAAAMQDMRLQLKGRLLSLRHIGLGLIGTVAFPTGDRAAFSGTGQISFAPRLAVEARVRILRVGLNAGVLLRQEGGEGPFAVSHELFYSLGVGVRPHRRVELLGDLYGSTSLARPFAAAQSPTEAVGAVALHLGPVALSAGGGAGLVDGYGAPSYRAFLSLRYQQAPRPVAVAHRPPPPPPRITQQPPPEPEPEPEPPAQIGPPTEAQITQTEYRAPLEIAVTATQLIPSRPIYFEFNRARVRHEFYPVLDGLADFLRQHPELGIIHIEGHTDIIGSPEYNQSLSRRRAQAVREGLIERGINPGRLEAVGYGATRPAVDNSDEASRSRNRRVLFYHALIKAEAAR